MFDVCTSITAGKDSLREDQEPQSGDVKFTAFLDWPASSQLWNVRPACEKFRCPAMNSRIHKIMPHLYFPEAKYSLCMDGTLALRVRVEELFRDFLGDADVAMFAHPDRDCLYDELVAATPLSKYSAAEMAEQVERYRAYGWPPHAGLWENAVILRTHTPAARRFNECWWAEMCRGSRLDQLACPVAAHKSGVRIAVIPGSQCDNPFFSYAGHRHED